LRLDAGRVASSSLCVVAIAPRRATVVHRRCTDGDRGGATSRIWIAYIDEPRRRATEFWRRLLSVHVLQLAIRGVPRVVRPLALAVTLVTGVALPDITVVRADSLRKLDRELRRSRQEKVRIGAAVSLGRLRDPRSIKPLVWALLKDRSRVVRSVAASALGNLGDARALPALRRAMSDPDPSVRKRATESAARIEQRGAERAAASGRMPPLPAPGRAGQLAVAPYERSRLGAEPPMYVEIKSVSDKSPGRASPRQRLRHSARMRALLTQELRASRAVTLDPAAAEQEGVRAFTLDVTIQRLELKLTGPWAEMVCEVQLSVSNGRGQMLSLLTGGAIAQVPRGSYRRDLDPDMRRQALENAARSVHGDLLAYLHKELRE
jgi:hypothetical protein